MSYFDSLCLSVYLPVVYEHVVADMTYILVRKRHQIQLQMVVSLHVDVGN